MADDLPMRDIQLPFWVESMVLREPGPLRRLMRAIFSLGTRRPRSPRGYDDLRPPAEGAGVPARPKMPDPSLLMAAELELPWDSA